ncbi:MAG: amino acid ABC transporter permease [Marmoricola sp.]
MKRSTKRRLRRGALYLLLVGGVAALAALADWHAIRTNFLDGGEFKAIWPDVVTEAAKNTVVYTAIAFAGGLVLAFVLALMKLSTVAPYRWLATAYIEFFRGLPVLIVIIAFAFAVPIAFAWTPPGGSRGAAIIALIVVAAAYMAETIRAGLQAVPPGQREAAQSLGMSSTWTLFSVVLPQAVRIVIPPLTNEFVLLLKDTSLIQVAGIGLGQRELTNFASDNLNQSSNATPLLAAAVLYLIITLPLTQLVAHLERRTKRAR